MSGGDARLGVIVGLAMLSAVTVAATMGGGVDYGSDFVGRYSTVKAELGAIAMAPSIAYKVNDKFSIGGVIAGIGQYQSISDAPPARADLVRDFTKLKVVKEAQKSGKGKKGVAPYQKFLRGVGIARAEKALLKESYSDANFYYQVLYEKGVKDAPIIYGLAKSGIGDFAFSATEAQRKETERLYREAAAKDPKYALPYRGLGELYEDSERYGDAAKAYQKYVKLAPKAMPVQLGEKKLPDIVIVVAHYVAWAIVTGIVF